MVLRCPDWRCRSCRCQAGRHPTQGLGRTVRCHRASSSRQEPHTNVECARRRAIRTFRRRDGGTIPGRTGSPGRVTARSGEPRNQTMHECLVVVPSARMHHKTCRLVHDDDVVYRSRQHRTQPQNRHTAESLRQEARRSRGSARRQL